MELSIIPECYIDTNLIETITSPNKGYNHQKGCNKVSSLMQGKFSDSFALGIIDKDKREIPYLLEFNELCQKEFLTLFKHKSKSHYIIQIQPAVEAWIIEASKNTDIKLEDFDLPTDIKELTRVSKRITSKNDPRFRRLFITLLREQAEPVLLLSKWINYLKSNTYNSSIDEIIKL